MAPGTSRITQALSSANTDGYLVDLLDTVPFHLAFRSEDGSDAQTSILLSEKLTKKGATPLQDLRTGGNLYVLSTLCLDPILPYTPFLYMQVVEIPLLFSR